MRALSRDVEQYYSSAVRDLIALSNHTVKAFLQATMSHRSAAAAGAGSGGGRQCVRCLYLIFVLWSILCVASQVEATKKSKFKKSHHKTSHPTPSPSPSPRPSPAPGHSPSPSPPGNSHGTVFDIRKTGAVGNGVQDDTQVIHFSQLVQAQYHILLYLDLKKCRRTPQLQYSLLDYHFKKHRSSTLSL